MLKKINKTELHVQSPKALTARFTKTGRSSRKTKSKGYPKRGAALILCLAAASASFAGCTANEDAFEAKSYAADATQATALRIDVKDRKIELTHSPDEKIHIDYYESGKEFYDLAVTEQGTLVMASADNKGWTDYVGTSPSLENRTIRIQLPDNRLKSISLKTSNEDIFIPALSFSDSVSVSVNKGSIELERLDAGKTINLEVKDGSITGTVAGGYDDFAISCTVKKGKCNLPESKDGGEKTLDVSVNNGDIDLQLAKA